mmetsp:Transcript_5122/g.11380  ORF Transcript_5122/g.11380 Transcript_5122/m.11380 type:complete len:220 (+) Transcript_5122:246-905(+)
MLSISIDWISSGKTSSRISSMTSSIEMSMLITAVMQIFLMPYATGLSEQFSPHASPGLTTVLLILAKSSIRSCSSSHGFTSRLHRLRCLASFLASRSIAIFFFSSVSASLFALSAAAFALRSLAGSAFSSSSSSSSPKSNSSSSSSSAAAGLAAFLAGAAALVLADGPAEDMAAMAAGMPWRAAMWMYQRYACGRVALSGTGNCLKVWTSPAENEKPIT